MVLLTTFSSVDLADAPPCMYETGCCVSDDGPGVGPVDGDTVGPTLGLEDDAALGDDDDSALGECVGCRVGSCVGKLVVGGVVQSPSS